MKLFRKSFVVTINAAVPIVVVETALPGGEREWEVEAFAPITSSPRQMLIAEGNFQATDIANRTITGGPWDVLMVVPAAPGARVPCGNPQVLTFFSDTAVAVNLAATIVIREVPTCP